MLNDSGKSEELARVANHITSKAMAHELETATAAVPDTVLLKAKPAMEQQENTATLPHHSQPASEAVVRLSKPLKSILKKPEQCTALSERQQPDEQELVVGEQEACVRASTETGGEDVQPMAQAVPALTLSASSPQEL